MPCRSGYDPDYERDYHYIKFDNDNLTQLLCEACRHIDNNGFLLKWNISGDLKNWWKEHKAQDDERQKTLKEQQELEKIRLAALQKLSTEEIKALGLDKK